MPPFPETCSSRISKAVLGSLKWHPLNIPQTIKNSQNCDLVTVIHIIITFRWDYCNACSMGLGFEKSFKILVVPECKSQLDRGMISALYWEICSVSGHNSKCWFLHLRNDLRPRYLKDMSSHPVELASEDPLLRPCTQCLCLQRWSGWQLQTKLFQWRHLTFWTPSPMRFAWSLLGSLSGVRLKPPVYPSF